VKTASINIKTENRRRGEMQVKQFMMIAASPIRVQKYDNTGGMGVVVKRVYEPAVPSDGVRVLVDRLWPRGLTKQDVAFKFWMRELAPTNELRQWFHANADGWRMFRRRYLKELAGEEASAALEKLHHLAEGKRRVTLLYASRNQEHNNATVLKELLEGMKKPPSSVGRGALGRGRIRKAKRQ
jgi:uncharacterized protein YeaO (DUF488 family)